MNLLIYKKINSIFIAILLIIYFFGTKTSYKTNSENLNLYSIRKEIELNNIYNKFDIKRFSFFSFSKVKNPKISIIITIYNQKEFILKIYSCILKQSFKKIEIIFIDDASIDNSFIYVKKLMKKDKRILYLKNKKNRGQFNSRNKGVLYSKGDFVIIIDPDDFLLNNILIKCYKKAIKYNLDIIQFYHLIGDVKNNSLVIINKRQEICFQPETTKLFFEYNTRYLWDKLIRRNIFIKSINFMHKQYRKKRFIIHNDEVACYGIFKLAHSYWQVKEVGYLYNRKNNKSITKSNFYPENINGRFYSLFSIMDYYYEQSKNNKYEKTKGGYSFFEIRIVRVFGNKIKYLTEGFEYINNILLKYIRCPFFNSSQKSKLKKFRFKIDIQKDAQKQRLLNQSFYIKKDWKYLKNIS